MFIQRYSSCFLFFFVQSVFLHRYFLCILERVTEIEAVQYTYKYIQKYYQNSVSDQSGRCMGIKSSEVCFVSDLFLPAQLKYLKPSSSPVQVPHQLTQFFCCFCTRCFTPPLFIFPSWTQTRPYICLHMYSFMAIFGLQECIHPIFIFLVPFVCCDFFSFLHPGVQFSLLLV